MMGLVPYNLSPIQQGIQFGHAVQEYNNEILDLIVEKSRGLILEPKYRQTLSAFERWAKFDKTFIILNGGTTNTNIEKLGTLNQHQATLKENKILVASFYEPDLGDQLTAVVFLVDDRVFDKVTWPDFVYENETDYVSNPKCYDTQFYEWKMKFSDNEKEADQIIFLRDWLKNFRLA